MATGTMPGTSLTSGCTQSPSSLWWWRWGEQPSEMLQAVRHFLFALQAKPLGFGPEWPLFVEADISAERRKAACLLVTLFSQGKQ